MSRWFRFYDTALDDPKVQRLPADVFKGWINILCLASKHGGALPSLPDIAFALRITDREADSLVTVLMEAGLLDDEPQGLAPHRWAERQYSDATAAERMRKYRARKANTKAVTTPLRVTPVTVTPAEEDTETETEKKETNLKVGKARKRATPIPEGFPSEAEIRWTLKQYPKLSAWGEAESFRDHSLKNGTEWKDWPAAWRSWCRNAVRFAEERNRRFA